jgi:uncharacterized LabA/DUF88 family protein
MAERLVLFIDYQNLYRGCRETFFDQWQDAHVKGQVDPIALGELLATRGLKPRELVQVRVYRGLPDSARDPKGYGACFRQCEVWRKDPKAEVITRPLRYPVSWPKLREEEKGIDVSLAVDYVMMAVKGEFDVGIIISTDTDLKPALEAVLGLQGNPYPRVELAAWSSPTRRSRRLSIPGSTIWCHWLDENDYWSVSDTTNYAPT